MYCIYGHKAVKVNEEEIILLGGFGSHKMLNPDERSSIIDAAQAMKNIISIRFDYVKNE